MFLTPEQVKALKALSVQTDAPVAALVRKAIDAFLSEAKARS